MNQMARQAKNEYMREWRKKNPEKVKSHVQRYLAKKQKNSERLKNNAALEQVLSGAIENEEKSKILTGIYFDADVLSVLDALVRKGKNKRGLKSQIVNDEMRKAFREKGLL